MNIVEWSTNFGTVQWYAVSIAAITACLLLYCIGSILSIFLITRFRLKALTLFAYPLLIHRKYWGGVTRLQAGAVGGYFIINGACMGIGIETTSDLALRCGMMASVNMIPLFLGGRTSMLANFLGISLHTYYLAHHWIGRIVIVQSLLHVGLVIASGKPWTFDSSQISGISSASALALILLSSLYLIRRLVYEFFLKLHLFLAFIAVLALLLHSLPVGSKGSIFPIVSLALWGFNALLRLSRMAYYNLGGRTHHKTGQAEITHFVNDSAENVVSAMRVKLRLRKPLDLCRPGQYVYLSLSDMGARRRFQSHPYVITWWDDSMNAMNLSFLIQPQAGISAELISRNSIRRVTIDGPYGKDLHLDSYETVILVARGIGIAGILPYIRHMTYRRASKEKEHEAYRRGLITRKIDVYWVLEDNFQEDWVSEWIAELQQRDSEKLILTFSCFYPNKQSKPPPVPNDPHWRFVYQQEALPIIEGLLVKQVQRSPGKTKVAVCGNAEFSNMIRCMVIKTMSEYPDVEFVETEFQPEGVRQAYRGIHVLDRDDIELDSISFAKNVEKGSRLVSKRLSVNLRGKKIRSSDREDDRESLVRKHSGLTSKLETLKEKDESIDLEAQPTGHKAEVKEFV